MRFLPLVATSLLAFAHSAWADGQPAVGTWTLSDVRRSRSPDNTTCNWSLSLEASEIKGARPPVQCKFEVRGTRELGCDKHDLGDVPCTDGVSHYFNELPNGSHVDLTRDQFPVTAQFTPAETRTRDYVLSHPDTAARYQLLRTELARFSA